jgi:hypothetical protein
MKRVKIAIYISALGGLGVVGGAMWATSALAALPEFLPASGTFLSTSGAVTLETASGTELACSSDKDKGLITGPESVANILITFHGCKTSGFACSSGTEPSGVITTQELSGLLGYISKASRSVGIDLVPVSGTELVEFNCLGDIIKVKIKGSVIGEVTPLNSKTTNGTLTYLKAAGKGKQEVTKLEGGAIDLLQIAKNGGAFEGSAIEAAETITFHQPTEVMA